jgi:4-amino-4-deoxy-L-arabinose transferase-like glycosyltransferase
VKSPAARVRESRYLRELATRNGGPAALATLGLLIVLGLGLRIGFAIDAPVEQPPDSAAYAQIAENLYRDGSFDARAPGVQKEVQPSSAYSPGLPLFAAGVYELTGGAHLTLARVLLALLGAATIPLTYLLGRRMASPLAGLIGAAAIAIYPALLEYQGLLLTESLAAFLLSASFLSFFWASDPAPAMSRADPVAGQGSSSSQAAGEEPRPRATRALRWLVPGLLFGILALVRPEYLLVGIAFAVLAVIKVFLGSSWKSALLSGGLVLGALLLTIAPWVVRNQVVIDRSTISTGGGKALFIGTYLEADGDGPKLRELLLSQRPVLRARLASEGPLDDPDRYILERVLNEVASESYPNLSTDEALGRLGRQNLESNVANHPIRFTEMLTTKAFNTWTDTARASMQKPPWRALQLGVLAFALGGLVVLAARRRFEAAAAGVVLLYVTAIGALLIASPRRELVVLPLLAALAGVGATACRDSLARWRR